MYKVGQCLEEGKGIPRNETEAVKWYQKSAEKNNVEGKEALGRCYACGIGVAKDLHQARIWYIFAAAGILTMGDGGVSQAPAKGSFVLIFQRRNR